MQVSYANEVKIYNLSAGKSLPEWLTDRKKRQLQKNDLDIRQRIELIQDLEMPSVSSTIEATPDGSAIYVTGAYKPRVRCYELSNLSLKFERGLDLEVVKTKVLSDDYSKVVFLQVDRHIEFHNQAGIYYRTRIPKFGRDMSYHTPSCDMYIVGASSQIYRLNLELGRFMTPFQTDALELNCCELNPEHHLFTCGTTGGMVECWDPRTKKRAGILDCALNKHIKQMNINDIPAVTSLKYQNALHFGVGTSTGHVLLYDLRSSQPLLVKDHNYDLPIKSLHFQQEENLVLSMDSKILRLWNQHTGRAYTAIEPGVPLTALTVYPKSGLIFIANEAPKVLVYFLPSIGTAPKWCSFLDNLTEELEENKTETVYDDYKFVTRRELDDLGLTHLIGSKMLRAYMHGFFLDIRLYHKAKALTEPFAYENYKKEKVRAVIEKNRASRVKIGKLPKVNKDLARKLMMNEEKIPTSTAKLSKEEEKASSLLKDKRFESMFTDPNFQIDRESNEYHLINPLVSKLDRVKAKKERQRQMVQKQFEPVKEDLLEGRASEESSSEDSEEDEKKLRVELKKAHRKIRERNKNTEEEVEEEKLVADEKTNKRKPDNKPKFYQIKEGDDILSERKKKNKKTLSERLASNESQPQVQTGIPKGHMEMTFTFKHDDKETSEKDKAKMHHIERKKIRRTAHEITRTFKNKPKFWMGKRVH